MESGSRYKRPNDEARRARVAQMAHYIVGAYNILLRLPVADIHNVCSLSDELKKHCTPFFWKKLIEADLSKPYDANHSAYVHDKRSKSYQERLKNIETQTLEQARILYKTIAMNSVLFNPPLDQKHFSGMPFSVGSYVPGFVCFMKGWEVIKPIRTLKNLMGNFGVDSQPMFRPWDKSKENSKLSSNLVTVCERHDKPQVSYYGMEQAPFMVIGESKYKHQVHRCVEMGLNAKRSDYGRIFSDVELDVRMFLVDLDAIPNLSKYTLDDVPNIQICSGKTREFPSLGGVIETLESGSLGLKPGQQISLPLPIRGSYFTPEGDSNSGVIATMRLILSADGEKKDRIELVIGRDGMKRAYKLIQSNAVNFDRRVKSLMPAHYKGSEMIESITPKGFKQNSSEISIQEVVVAGKKHYISYNEEKQEMNCGHFNDTIEQAHVCCV